MIDGSKALRKAIRQVFGDDVPVQRCVRHKERNVLELLPDRDRAAIKRRLTQAWQETNYTKALEQLRRLAVELDHEHPGAAASLREGLEETLSVTRLGITGKLKRTLQSTNACESMIGTVRVIHRNAKNWSSGEMCLRWTAAGTRRRDPVPQGRGPPRPRPTRDPRRNRHHQTTQPTPSRVDTAQQRVTGGRRVPQDPVRLVA